MLEFPSKDKSMADSLPKYDDKEYQEMSQDAKDIVTEQGNREAYEILMITDTVQCKSCDSYTTPGHTYCKCGRMLPGASDEVKKQVLQNVMNGLGGRSDGFQSYHKALIVTKVQLQSKKSNSQAR